jgi:hypothetical protein
MDLLNPPFRDGTLDSRTESADIMTSRCDLLLSRIGPEAFKVVMDHFRPEEVGTRTYDQVKDVLHGYYSKNVCIMAGRVALTHRHRRDGETVTQFVNALRSMAGNCGFGASLAEHLRYQLHWNKQRLSAAGAFPVAPNERLHVSERRSICVNSKTSISPTTTSALFLSRTVHARPLQPPPYPQLLESRSERHLRQRKQLR